MRRLAARCRLPGVSQRRRPRSATTTPIRPPQPKRSFGGGRSMNESISGRSYRAMWVFPVITAALGTWQVYRHGWKKELLRARNERRHAAPVDLPDAPTDEWLEEHKFCRVHVSGEFQHDDELLVGPRTMDGAAGFHVITPFQREDNGERILINRGWVPNGSRLPSQREDGLVQGQVQLTAVVREGGQQLRFTPDNDVATRTFYWIDLPLMAELTGSVPIILDATATREQRDSPTYPLGGQTNYWLPNNHLTYVFTWYTLSAVLAFMCIRANRPQAVRTWKHR